MTFNLHRKVRVAAVKRCNPPPWPTPNPQRRSCRSHPLCSVLYAASVSGCKFLLLLSSQLVMSGHLSPKSSCPGVVGSHYSWPPGAGRADPVTVAPASVATVAPFE